MSYEYIYIQNPTKEITKIREEEEPNISWFVNTNRRGIRLRIIQMQAPMLFSKLSRPKK